MPKRQNSDDLQKVNNPLWDMEPEEDKGDEAKWKKAFSGTAGVAGKLSKKQATKLFSGLGVSMSQQEKQAVMDSIDKDGSGEVDFNEFKSAMKERMQVKKFKDVNSMLAGKVFGAIPGTGGGTANEEDGYVLDRRAWLGMLHPQTKERAMWDIGQMVALIYTFAVLPYRLAFGVETEPFYDANGECPVANTICGVPFWLDAAVDISFICDLVLNFNAYVKHPKTGLLTSDTKVIRRSYMRGWFAIDFLSSLPVDYSMRMYSGVSGDALDTQTMADARGAKAIRLLKLARMLRFARLAKLLNFKKMIRFAQIMRQKIGLTKMKMDIVWRMSVLAFILFLSAHVWGCSWIAIGRYYHKDHGGSYSETWWSKYARKKTNPNCVASATPDCMMPTTNIEQYINAFYFMLVTISTVGFGDIYPITYSEKVFITFVIIYGMFVYAYVIGQFADIVASAKRDQSMFEEKMRSVGTYLKFLEAPKALTKRVKQYYEYRYAKKTLFNEDAIFKELPSRVRRDLMLHRFQSIIQAIPFFRGCDDGLILSICLHFSTHSCVPGDVICEAGSSDRELILIDRGRAEAKSNADGTGSAIMVHPAGSFFGEMEFLGLSLERKSTVVAATYCELFVLVHKDIEGLLTSNPDLQRKIERYATLRKQMFQAISNGASDVDLKNLAGKLDESNVERPEGTEAAEIADNSHALLVEAAALIHDAERPSIETCVMEAVLQGTLTIDQIRDCLEEE